jgi:pimeloyl-ACP methyl ester carboxylesterase
MGAVQVRTQLLKLVLLPGLDGTGRFFARLQRCFGDRVALQIVSYPANQPMGYDELIDYVRAQIGAEPAVVLGESFSGPIAVRLAANHPEQIKGLILAATFLTSPWPRWMLSAAALANPGLVPRSWIDAVLRGPADDPELAAEIATIMAGFNAEVRSTRLRAVAGANVLNELLRVTCPILALHGRSDWLVPKYRIVKALKAKPGATVKLLDGPHMLLQRNPTGSANAIEDFLKSIDRQV